MYHETLLHVYYAYGHHLAIPIPDFNLPLDILYDLSSSMPAYTYYSIPDYIYRPETHGISQDQDTIAFDLFTKLYRS